MSSALELYLSQIGLSTDMLLKKTTTTTTTDEQQQQQQQPSDGDVRHPDNPPDPGPISDQHSPSTTRADTSARADTDADSSQIHNNNIITNTKNDDDDDKRSSNGSSSSSAADRVTYIVAAEPEDADADFRYPGPRDNVFISPAPGIDDDRPSVPADGRSADRETVAPPHEVQPLLDLDDPSRDRLHRTADVRVDPAEPQVAPSGCGQAAVVRCTLPRTGPRLDELYPDRPFNSCTIMVTDSPATGPATSDLPVTATRPDPSPPSSSSPPASHSPPFASTIVRCAASVPVISSTGSAPRQERTPPDRGKHLPPSDVDYDRASSVTAGSGGGGVRLELSEPASVTSPSKPETKTAPNYVSVIRIGPTSVPVISDVVGPPLVKDPVQNGTGIHRGGIVGQNGQATTLTMANGYLDQSSTLDRLGHSACMFVPAGSRSPQGSPQEPIKSSLKKFTPGHRKTKSVTFSTGSVDGDDDDGDDGFEQNDRTTRSDSLVNDEVFHVVDVVDGAFQQPRKTATPRVQSDLDDCRPSSDDGRRRHFVVQPPPVVPIDAAPRGVSARTTVFVTSETFQTGQVIPAETMRKRGPPPTTNVSDDKRTTANGINGFGPRSVGVRNGSAATLTSSAAKVDEFQMTTSLRRPASSANVDYGRRIINIGEHPGETGENEIETLYSENAIKQSDIWMNFDSSSVSSTASQTLPSRKKKSTSTKSPKNRQCKVQ